MKILLEKYKIKIIIYINNYYIYKRIKVFKYREYNLL